LKEAKKIHNEEADATIALSKNGNELNKRRHDDFNLTATPAR